MFLFCAMFRYVFLLFFYILEPGRWRAFWWRAQGNWYIELVSDYCFLLVDFVFCSGISKYKDHLRSSVILLLLWRSLRNRPWRSRRISSTYDDKDYRLSMYDYSWYIKNLECPNHGLTLTGLAKSIQSNSTAEPDLDEKLWLDFQYHLAISMYMIICTLLGSLTYSSYWT